MFFLLFFCFFFQAEDGIRDLVRSRGLGDVYKRQPLMRVLDASSIDDSIKQSLKDQYEELNPAELKRQIVKIQNQLIEMVTLKNDSIPYPKEVNLV